MSGILLSEPEKKKLLMLEQLLQQRVVGQDKAVKLVADAIRRSRAGLSDPDRPIASFLFMGPTGVGKTELAKALAACVFNSESALVQIHVAGFPKEHVMTQLVGNPDCCGDGVCLTEAVSWRPHSVVLLENIEDAHRDVLNILLKLLRDGRITDYQGRTVSFTNAVVIMTSNMESDCVLKPLWKTEQSRDVVCDAMERHVVELARQTFPPEFSEIVEYVVFQPLDSRQLSKFVEIRLNIMKDRFKQQRKINFHYTKEVVTLFATMDYGLGHNFFEARSVMRVIQRMVADQVGMELSKQNYAEQDTMILDQAITNGLCIKKLSVFFMN